MLAHALVKVLGILDINYEILARGDHDELAPAWYATNNEGSLVEKTASLYGKVSEGYAIPADLTGRS